MAALLETKALGQIDLSSAEIFHFPEGIIGFSEEKEFALIQESEDSLFLWLQSTHQAELAFVVIEPKLFCKRPYLPQVTHSDIASLKVGTVDACKVYVIVTIPSDCPEKMTGNLQGPILINPTDKLGSQVISIDDSHSVCVPILGQMEN